MPGCYGTGRSIYTAVGVGCGSFDGVAPMPSISAFAETASLVGDPARANMLAALMGGRALTASELARVAGIAPQTASGHLARLTEGGLLAVTRQGRHRYHSLASQAVAQMLEGIMSVSADLGARGVTTGPRDKAMRHARTCYDHLAGRIAVAMADSMLARGQIDLTADGGALTDTGTAFIRSLGVTIAAENPARRNQRVFCRPCLDWSERRPHIAGTLGAALCRTCFDRGWIRRLDGTRAVSVTPAGHLALTRAFGAMEALSPK